MFIHEAIKEALVKGKSIRRRRWEAFGWWIMLTEPIMSFTKKKRKDGYCWNPTPEDLAADDWILFDSENGLKENEILAHKDKTEIRGITIEIPATD